MENVRTLKNTVTHADIITDVAEFVGTHTFKVQYSCERHAYSFNATVTWRELISILWELYAKDAEQISIYPTEEHYTIYLDRDPMGFYEDRDIDVIATHCICFDPETAFMLVEELNANIDTTHCEYFVGKD